MRGDDLMLADRCEGQFLPSMLQGPLKQCVHRRILPEMRERKIDKRARFCGHVTASWIYQRHFLVRVIHRVVSEQTHERTLFEIVCDMALRQGGDPHSG